jgi:hypothetical protein
MSAKNHENAMWIDSGATNKFLWAGEFTNKEFVDVRINFIHLLSTLFLHYFTGIFFREEIDVCKIIFT